MDVYGGSRWKSGHPVHCTDLETGLCDGLAWPEAPQGSRPQAPGARVAPSLLLQGMPLCPACLYLVVPRCHLAVQLLSPHVIDSQFPSSHTGHSSASVGAASPPDLTLQCQARVCVLHPPPDLPSIHGCICHLWLTTPQSHVPPLDSYPASPAHSPLPLNTQTALALTSTKLDPIQLRPLPPSLPQPRQPQPSAEAARSQEPGAALDSCSH